MVYFAKVPKDFRKHPIPEGHRPLFRQEFNKGFTVCEDGYLHFFDRPIGTTEVKLTRLQKWALIATAAGALGTCSAGFLSVAKSPVELMPANISFPLDEKIKIVPEFDISISVPNLTDSRTQPSEIVDGQDRIQLKCAPFEYEGAPPRAYLCSQEIPPL